MPRPMAKKLSRQIDDVIDELIKVRLRCQPVIAIVGSGISSPQIPLMDQIVDHAVHVFDEKRFSADPVLKRNPALKTKEGLRKLFREDPDPILRDSTAWQKGVMPWLKKKERKSKPQQQHRALIKLLRHNLLRAVLTTNWDCLLEDSAGSRRNSATGDFLIIRDAISLDSWIQRPSGPPAIVKLHGDVRELRCENEHVTIGDSNHPDMPFACPRCGKTTTPRLLLPDSARRLSREMIAYFQGSGTGSDAERNHTAQQREEATDDRPCERFDYLGAILVIGFSGRYDQHLLSLIRARARQHCFVASIDLKKLNVFTARASLLQGNARQVVPLLTRRWMNKTATITNDYPVGHIPPLDFVPSEERFDALFGRIPITNCEAKIVSHPDFARLRYIKQLGQKQRFYPSADHSRFEHAIGALSVVDKLYRGLVLTVQRARRRRSCAHALQGYAPTPAERRLVRLATLFHDFGHIWFSHLGEAVLEDLTRSRTPTGEGPPVALQRIFEAAERRHENLVREFLVANSNATGSLGGIVEAEVIDIGRTLGVTMDDFHRLLAGRSRLGHLNCLVASSVDSDKLEYLNRDASRTRAGGGSAIKPGSVAAALEITEFGRTAVRLEAVAVVEQVAAERYLMFQSVYHDDRVRALEASLAEVLTDYLAVRLAGADKTSTVRVLLYREGELVEEVRNEVKEHSHDPDRLRHKHWLEVLDLIGGVGKFPPLEIWLLRPADHIRQLPLQDARTSVQEMCKFLRSELGDLFSSRYRYRAVFALDKFTAHTGIDEVPISGESRLYSPSEVSPLIAGLQDVRRVPIRLAVAYYDRQIARGCAEEIEAILLRQARDLEVTVRLRPEGDDE